MKQITCLLLLGLLTGCAGYTITPFAATTDKWPTEEGYVVYEPVPYLKLVVSASKDTPTKLEYSAEIIYLPNKTHAYRIKTYACLASATAKFTYQNGWMLTNSEATIDTTAVVKSLIDIAGKLVKVGGPTPIGLPEGIYLIELKFGGDGKLSGLGEPFAMVSAQKP